MKKLTLLAAGTALTFAGFNAAAAPVTLGDLMGGEYSALPYTDNHSSYAQLTDTDGFQDSAFASLLLKNNDQFDGSTFGIYSYQDNANKLQVFDGSAQQQSVNGRTRIWFDLSQGVATTAGPLEGDGAVSCDTVTCANIGSQFGFYMTDVNGDNTWYSDPTFNADGADHARMFETADGQYDGLLNGSDVVVSFNDNHDGSDYVVGIQDVSSVSESGGGQDVSSVPEPAPLALFGLGLVGLGLTYRRKKA